MTFFMCNIWISQNSISPLSYHTCRAFFDGAPQYAVPFSCVIYGLAKTASRHCLVIHAGPFCDGTRRYGVPAPFSKGKKTIICNVYY